MKKQLLQVWKSTGKKPKQLQEQPPCPDELSYLWRWYLSIEGASRLTYTEIKAWADLFRVQLSAIELDVIRKLDHVRWEVSNG